MADKCTLCPRNCGVDRDNGKIGYCGQTDKVYVARAALHMWEEPCISGKEDRTRSIFPCNTGFFPLMQGSSCHTNNIAFPTISSFSAASIHTASARTDGTFLHIIVPFTIKQTILYRGELIYVTFAVNSARHPHGT